jgi:N-acetylmuramic acid 6-phosphate etherase
MVDMQLSNQKLIDRGTKMVMRNTNLSDYEKAKELLIMHGSVRKATEAFFNN